MTITEIIAEARSLGDADSNSYQDADILRRVNSSLEVLVGKIEEVSDFHFDDENFANIAEGTITLTEGEPKYTITDRFRHILEVKVKDIHGDYQMVNPVNQEEDSRIVEEDEAESGLPYRYRMVGRSIFLRYAPTATEVTLTAGLLFKYTRTSYQITSGDVTTGTLIPGIDSVYHPLIAKMSALPYCKTYKKDRVTQLERDIAVETKDCVNFYSSRLKNKHHRITTKRRCFR